MSLLFIVIQACLDVFLGSSELEIGNCISVIYCCDILLEIVWCR